MFKKNDDLIIVEDYYCSRHFFIHKDYLDVIPNREPTLTKVTELSQLVDQSKLIPAYSTGFMVTLLNGVQSDIYLGHKAFGINSEYLKRFAKAFGKASYSIFTDNDKMLVFIIEGKIIGGIMAVKLGDDLDSFFESISDEFTNLIKRNT